MATITGTQISNRVGILLQDEGSTRWTAAERLGWMNDGRREMAHAKPTIFGSGTEVTHTTTAGNKQTIGTSGAYSIVSVDSNVSTGKAIIPCTKVYLDAFRSTWRSDSGTEVQNWFPDEIDQVSFWVYPAVGVGVDLKAHVFITPADLGALTDVALPFDQYEPVLVNYVCYRALAKEDEAGAVQKAQAFYELFKAGLS